MPFHRIVTILGFSTVFVPPQHCAQACTLFTTIARGELPHVEPNKSAFAQRCGGTEAVKTLKELQRDREVLCTPIKVTGHDFQFGKELFWG